MNIPFVSDYLKYRSDLRAENKAMKAYVGGSISFMDMLSSNVGFGGDKFAGGFGITKDFQVVNLKLLQFRSIQLITENDYSLALFKRLQTKVINRGLKLNSAPIFEILGEKIGHTDTELRGWSRKVEARFHAWGKDRELISWDKNHNWHELQIACHWSKMLSGDCLVIISINKIGLPVIKLVDGFYISSPVLPNQLLKKGHTIVYGIEKNAKGEQVAAWIEDGCGHVRVPFYARGTGRRRAFLVYGSKRRVSDVRGFPALGVFMQNINEIGKYKDSEQRAALVNSYIAMTRNRGKNQGPAASFSRRRNVISETTKTNAQGNEVKFEQSQPGLYLANLAPDEIVTSYDTKRPNANFGAFVENILKPIAYTSEIPPEIFFLEFGSNFSASRQATNELHDFLKKEVKLFSGMFNNRIYIEFLTGEILNGDIKAPGYVESLRVLKEWDVKNAWQNANWRGLPNISVDLKKQVQALREIREENWLTSEDIAEIYFQSDYFDNARRNSIENDVANQANEQEIENSDERIDSPVAKKTGLAQKGEVSEIDCILKVVEKKFNLFSDKINNITDLVESVIDNQGN